MNSKKENIPFSYQRGNVKLTGRTNDDRKAVRLDTIMYWVTRIIVALTVLASIIIKAFA